jgi:hypothetical protein
MWIEAEGAEKAVWLEKLEKATKHLVLKESRAGGSLIAQHLDGPLLPSEKPRLTVPEVKRLLAEGRKLRLELEDRLEGMGIPSFEARFTRCR